MAVSIAGGFGGVLPLFELNAFLPQKPDLPMWERILREFQEQGGYLLRFHADNITRCEHIQQLTALADALGLAPYTAINGVKSGYSPLDADVLAQTNLYCVSIMTDSKLIGDESYAEDIQRIMATKTKLELYLKITKSTLWVLEPVAEFCLAHAIPACIVDIERFPHNAAEKLTGEAYLDAVQRCMELNRRYVGRLRMSVADCPYLCAMGTLNMKGGCTAGVISCAVTEDGILLPCAEMAHLPVGDLKRSPLSQLWQTSAVFMRLRDRSTLTGRCGVCLHREKCGGCRAESYIVNGDYFGGDPLCPIAPEG